LLIRRTKFQRTRLVPLHATAVTGLAHYLMSRSAIRWRPRLCVGRWATARVLESSRRVPGLAEIGWDQALRRPMATDHELRYTLAVRTLESSPTGRQRIGQHMLALATCLGHVSIDGTYWYLYI
jgi:integrase